MSTLLILLTVVAAEEKPSAKQLFEGMQKKIESSKTLQLKHNGKLEAEGRTFLMKGTTRFAPGNKARVEMTMKGPGDNKTEAFLIADGKSLITIKPNESKRELDKNYSTKVKRFLATTGPLLGYLTVVTSDKGDIEEKVSNLALGKTEKVGKQQAQMISYDLKVNNDTHKAKLWLSTKTGLPLKRTITITMDGKKGTVTETYQCKLNPKLNDKLFQAPK